MARTLVNNASFAYPPNLLINSAMDYWQRSAASQNATATPAYLNVDRWQLEQSGGGTASFSRSTTTPDSRFPFSLQMDKAGATSAGRFFQRIETDLYAPYVGKQMCLSMWVRKQQLTGVIQSFTMMAFANTGAKDTWGSENTDQTTLLNVDVSSQVPTDGAWARIYSTFTIPTTTPTGIVIGLQMNINSANTSTLQVTGAMLTEGPSPPATFYRNATTLTGEFAACQRYYEKSYDSGTAPGTVTSSGSLPVVQPISTTRSLVQCRFLVAKRLSSPTVTIYSPVTGASGNADYNGTDFAVGILDLADSGFRRFSGTGLPTSVANTNGYHFVASAEL